MLVALFQCAKNRRREWVAEASAKEAKQHTLSRCTARCSENVRTLSPLATPTRAAPPSRSRFAGLRLPGEGLSFRGNRQNPRSRIVGPLSPLLRSKESSFILPSSPRKLLSSRAAPSGSLHESGAAVYAGAAVTESAAWPLTRPLPAVTLFGHFPFCCGRQM